MVMSRLTFRPTPLVASLPMIFYYHLFIGEVRTIRDETTYSIHGKYPLNQVRNLRNLNILYSTFLYYIARDIF